jgi:adenine C2-methylase RlmN of 23S rRNA A2503 and tRNA A37
MDLDRMARALAELGEPDYRLGQIWKWAAKGATSYAAMTNLPRSLRDLLTESAPFSTLTVERESTASDGTGTDAGPCACPRSRAARSPAASVPPGACASRAT